MSYEGILSSQLTAVVSIDNYFLQHIDVLADHDIKYFAISCMMFCSRCPPCPAIIESGGHVPPRAQWSRRLWKYTLNISPEQLPRIFHPDKFSPENSHGQTTLDIFPLENYFQTVPQMPRGRCLFNAVTHNRQRRSLRLKL